MRTNHETRAKKGSRITLRQGEKELVPSRWLIFFFNFLVHFTLSFLFDGQEKCQDF